MVHKVSAEISKMSNDVALKIQSAVSFLTKDQVGDSLERVRQGDQKAMQDMQSAVLASLETKQEQVSNELDQIYYSGESGGALSDSAIAIFESLYACVKTLKFEHSERFQKMVAAFPDFTARVLVRIMWDRPSDLLEVLRTISGGSEKERIELAKICARKHGKETAEHIRKFEITKEADRIEVAKVCSQGDQEFGGPAKYIREFDIRDEKALIEIARLCAQSGKHLRQNISGGLAFNRKRLVLK